MNQISSEVVFVEVIEVEIPQFVVADLVGKHVVDGHQNLVSYRDSGTLVTSPNLWPDFEIAATFLGLKNKVI